MYIGTSQGKFVRRKYVNLKKKNKTFLLWLDLKYVTKTTNFQKLSLTYDENSVFELYDKYDLNVHHEMHLSKVNKTKNKV